MSDESKIPPRRVPDELFHRQAHQAAGKAKKVVETLRHAHETVLWDQTASACMAALSGLLIKGKNLHPDDAAQVAAEYADALVIERRKRVEREESR